MKTTIKNGVTIISTGSNGGLVNKTGFRGLTYYPKTGKYRAEITIKKKKYSLGFYSDFEKAKAIRLEAEKHKEEDNLDEWLKEWKQENYYKKK